MKLFELLDNDKSAVFSVGRYNPPHKGHQKIINKVIELAEKQNSQHFIFPSHSQLSKDNPLTFSEKIKFMKILFPNANIMEEAEATNPFTSIGWLIDHGFKNLTMVVGEDRADEFEKILRPYINNPKKEKQFDLSNFKIISAGKRDPFASGIEGISASKARAFAEENNLKDFRKLIPGNKRIVKKLFDTIRSNIKLFEF